MSDHKPEKKIKPPQSVGWMAEYTDENQLLDACRQVRDSGYTRTDAYSPFPVHGIEDALGIKPTGLPWFSLCAGATGTCVALLMQWWMNAVDYPYIISGKPYASWPAFIPVTFELTVLFAAFTTVFAMLGLNGLPKLSNPLFNNPKFDRSTDDRFFLWVDSNDKYFNSEKVKGLLESTSPVEVSEVKEDDSPTEIPRGIIWAIILLIMVSLIPAVIVLDMRNSRSRGSRIQVFFDMDYQPNHKVQGSTSWFADHRVQRPPVSGTVARGELYASDPYYLGYDPDATASNERESHFVSLQADDANSAGQVNDPNSAEAAAPELNYAWLTQIPGTVDGKMYDLGKKKFDINCSVCHGVVGNGEGLVSQRAMNLAEGYWLQPTNLAESRIVEQPVGRIYYTITHGKGKMGGYAASLTPQERWAVVLYVRALQRSQNAKSSDIPENVTLSSTAAQ
ncbi:MAG: DUF3341 domain-containing protein [Planctomycetales bacterium]|nr:DUF3341 domain-containing protein [Planctomycetales bacterium]